MGGGGGDFNVSKRKGNQLNFDLREVLRNWDLDK